MTRYAIIQGGVAANVILWDGEGTLDIEGTLVEAPQYVGPGWLYDGGEWTSPFPVPEPPDVE